MRMRFLVLIFFTLLCHPLFSQSSRTFVFIGTYTNGQPDKGIYVYSLNSRNGKLKKVFSGQNITNPSYITLSPNGDYLYACTETKLPMQGSVSAYRVDSARGTLTFLNKQSSYSTKLKTLWRSNPITGGPMEQSTPRKRLILKRKENVWQKKIIFQK